MTTHYPKCKNIVFAGLASPKCNNQVKKSGFLFRNRIHDAGSCKELSSVSLKIF